MTPQRFETRRQVVEAVQLTADADWQAIAEWCGGEVCVCGREVYVPGACFDPGDGDWVIRIDEDTFIAQTESEFLNEFRPVPELEGVAGEIRQALEGTTPGPWKWEEDGGPMWLVGFDDADVLYGDKYECLHMTQADGELIAAAPELLARAADRIEALEQIWLRDLASALDRLAAAQLATAATTCIRCAAVLPEHDDDCTIVLARSILGEAKEGGAIHGEGDER